MKNPITTFKTLASAGNWLSRLLIATTVLLGISYIWQVNISATAGYAMRDLDREIATLEHDNERLELEVSRLRSVDSVTNRIQMLGLVPVEQVHYVIAGDSNLALNNQ